MFNNIITLKLISHHNIVVKKEVGKHIKIKESEV